MTADETLRRLRQPHAASWLAGVFFDWGVIALALLVAHRTGEPLAYVLAWLVVGNRQHALAIVGHDGAHGAAVRPRWLNDALTCLLCFWPLGLGLHGYRRHHFAHHRHTGEGSDPELEFKRRTASAWTLPTCRGRHLAQLLRDLFGLSPWELICLRRTLPAISVWDWLGPVVWWGCALALLFRFGAGWVGLLWLLSLGTGFWAFFRLRIWTEHLGVPGTHRIEIAWWHRLLVPHNTWCHWEHHRWPSIPSSRLPAARALAEGPPPQALSGMLDTYRKSPPLEAGVAPTDPATGEAS